MGEDNKFRRGQVTTAGKIVAWRSDAPPPVDKAPVHKSGNIGLAQSYTPRKAKHKGKQHVR